MIGKELRKRVDAFQDVLTDVEGFLQEIGKRDLESTEIIYRMRDDCEDLFYLIPLDKEE